MTNKEATKKEGTMNNIDNSERNFFQFSVRIDYYYFFFEYPTKLFPPEVVVALNR